MRLTLEGSKANASNVVQEGVATMPFTFEIDKTIGVIRETWSGLVDMGQIKTSCLQEWAHPDYKGRMPLISDFRQATANISPQDVVQFALWFGDKDTPARHAIVVGREFGFGFAKMFALMSDAAKSESNATRVFKSYEAADEWIGKPARSSPVE
jgi:hypothetical protein